MLGFEEVARRLADSAFHRLLGLELLAVEPTLRLRLPPAATLEGRPGSGFFHGGILATLIDTSGSFAVIAHAGTSVATVDLLIDYHRPAPLVPLVVEAELLRVGRTICTTRSQVCDEQGKLLASGRCSFIRVDIA